MAYVMNKERNLVPVPPSIGYYDGIQEGFKQNGLPEKSLREALKQVWRETSHKTKIMEVKDHER